MIKEFKTISSASEVELIINKSRFIGRCFPAEGEAAALSCLERVKKQHYDATHNCYAYRVAGGQTARYSDDGEPGGTAGLPMMEVLTRTGVSGLICTVTRYFGGVLLGAGGLVRAYSRAAAEAVEAARPVLMLPARQLVIDVEYPVYAVLEGYIRGLAGVQLKNVEYTERVRLELNVQQAALEQVIKGVTERTDGRAAFSQGGECYMEAPC